MPFIRLHTIPRKCESTGVTLTAKQRYLIKKSFERYSLTDDGKYINNLSLLTGEIGSIESVRFIEFKQE